MTSISNIYAVFNLPSSWWRKLVLLGLSAFFIYFGIDHFVNPDFYLSIMPPSFPLHEEAVYISGFFEIILGILLLYPQSRQIASYGLILLLIAVYPANLYLAFYEEPQKLIGISAFSASWIRLPIQFIFLWLAYWHSKD